MFKECARSLFSASCSVDRSNDFCAGDGARTAHVPGQAPGVDTGQGGDAVPALVPVEIAFTPAPASTCTPQPPSSPPAQRARVGIIEIELSGGCRVRVDRDVDAEALQRVLELLRRQ